MYSDLISLADLTTKEIVELLDLADDLKARLKSGEEFHPLKGQVLAMIFEKPSLRTRATFEIGIFQLGGKSLFIETRLGERESVPDVARNLERWVNGIVARTHSHGAVEQLAEYTSIPVINALTNKLHPCQILADAQALREHRGYLEGLKIVFVGDGNNIVASWANLASRFAFDFTLVCPEGYEIDDETRARAEREAKGSFRISHDPIEGVAGADAIYTDVWTSMGQENERETRLKDFEAYQVDDAMMARAKDDALFMHCLPAHRGEEVTNSVIESKYSIVFDQAENRLHAQKAVMVKLMQKA